MGIGLGIVLIVAGAILLWALEFDLEFIDNQALGVILLAVGALSVILVLVMHAQQNRKHIVDDRRRRYDDRY
jgi:uncharacterized membrane protein HdeD (DUF308 family)